MKLTKLILATVTLLCLSSILSQTCPNVFGKAFGEKNKPIKDADALYPSDLGSIKDYATAKSNALKQTLAARNLIYNPNEKALAFIKAVAKNLEALMNKNDFTSFNFIDFINSDEQRQTSKSGTAQEYYLLFNSKHVTDVKVATIKLLLKNFSATPTPGNIVALLGIIGDIGACVQDTFGRKETNKDKAVVAGILASYVNNLKGSKKASEEYYEKYSPDKYYFLDGKQDKKSERMSCFDKTDKKPNKDNDGAIEDKNFAKMTPRSGVMDTGDEADNKLNATTYKIPGIGWPWQTIPKKLPEFCKDEPWAGHFSGSLYELILMLQTFVYDPVNGKWDAQRDVETEKKEIAAALSSAFLIGLGMHTAVEVALPVKRYLGVTIPNIDITKDSKTVVDLKGKICAGATDYISNLMSKYAKPLPKKRKLK